jgi:hypothetical protein
MRDGTDLLTAAKAAYPAAWDLPVNPPERVARSRGIFLLSA